MIRKWGTNNGTLTLIADGSHDKLFLAIIEKQVCDRGVYLSAVESQITDVQVKLHEKCLNIVELEIKLHSKTLAGRLRRLLGM